MDRYKHLDTNIGGSRCILNRFWCIFWRPKAIFIKIFALHNRLHNKLSFYIFHIFICLNLPYIDYSPCQMWRVYMQYLRCCDHSNECLFLVFQQAEVLLNFFSWVYVCDGNCCLTMSAVKRRGAITKMWVFRCGKRKYTINKNMFKTNLWTPLKVMLWNLTSIGHRITLSMVPEVGMGSWCYATAVVTNKATWRRRYVA